MIKLDASAASDGAEPLNAVTMEEVVRKENLVTALECVRGKKRQHRHPLLREPRSTVPYAGWRKRDEPRATARSRLTIA